jgi:DNA helicase-2/ATP-dependent DNA helicase PcrA
MFDFASMFPEAEIIKLEENYRSTQPILTFTNALMDQASEKFTKCLFTKREGGDVPKVVDTRTDPEQAMFVCRCIQEMIQQGDSLRDVAVLFRASYHSFELEAELTRQGIRYVKYGGFKFLESAHIKDFLAHLRVGINRDEAVSWVRVLRLVKNVGQAKTHALIQWMRSAQIPPEGVSQWPGAGKGDGGLKSLGKLLSRTSSKRLSPKDAVEAVMEYYVPFLKEKFDDFPRRQRELEQLQSMAGRYGKLRNFLDDLILEPPTSASDMESGHQKDSLTLSTIHSAKGLEWSVVFVIWVAEGRFQPARSYGNPLVLEEERRLMYVAATRAKDRLVLSYPGQEWVPTWSSYGGAGAGHRSTLSGFLHGLPETVLSHESSSLPDQWAGRPRQEPSTGGSVGAPMDPSILAQGDRVNHPAFGPGVVSKLVEDDKVEVLFRNAGRKLLHLAYTTLEKI